MSGAPRSATLLERRADARVLSAAIKEHEHAGLRCPHCKCPEAAGMRAELAEIQAELRTWFDPPADAETLF